MGKNTSISWCDHSWNPWWGCTEVSPGCDNCYARVLDERWGESHWGKGVPRRVMSDSYWRQPLRWDALAKKEGVKHKVFCASMADVMDDEAPEGQRERLWELIDNTPNLIWQLLTKRPQRYERYFPIAGFKHWNLWLGTSAENQANYNLRWPFLKEAADRRGLVTFISYEPALGPLKLREKIGRPNWVICGGESGAGRRPMEQEWAENLRAECENDGVAFWMKQMSAQTPDKGKDLIPTHLLIHQFPGE